MFKFFYIVQIAYWLHIFPELYFQKVKSLAFISSQQLNNGVKIRFYFWVWKKVRYIYAISVTVPRYIFEAGLNWLQVKREDMPARIQYASLYLLFVGGAYLFSYTRVALCLLVLQYFTEAVFHTSRLLSYAEKTDIARPLYRIHDILFVLARLGSITLAVLTFWHGLAKASEAEQVIDWQNGTFNTLMFRITALVSICVLQVCFW